jgi:hypothetical protein
MTSTRGTKINRLLQAWPRGTVATQPWLTAHGVSSRLALSYVRAGWLTHLGPRAFLQAGDRAGWRGGLYALQSQLGMTSHVGARTALDLQGLSHFVPMGSAQLLVLISDKVERLPSWFRRHPWEARVEHHALALFEEIPEAATTYLDCGGFQIALSSPERAIMEEIRLTRTNPDIEHSIQLMENLSALRPRLVQQLLERCTAVKVKRFFLWSAEHAGHAWVDQLDSARVEVGSGKRQLYKGGGLDPKYAITVPQQESPPGV